MLRYKAIMGLGIDQAVIQLCSVLSKGSVPCPRLPPRFRLIHKPNNSNHWALQIEVG